MKNLLIGLVAAGLGLTGLAARAQGLPGPAKKAPAPVGVKRLTVEELGQMLEMLGYGPKPWQTKEGKLAGYNVSFTSGTWTMRFSVSLSGDGSNIWLDGSINGPLGAGVPVEALVKVLREGNSLWPAYLYCNEGNYLRLSLAFRNEGVTPSTMRQQMDTFSENIKRLIAVFKAAQPAPAPAPAPKG